MKISIITPCLNSEKTLEFTLNSVLSQSYKYIEHIIIDGGSTDDTKKILSFYPFKNKIIINKKTSLYEAINLGIKNATGEFVALLNSDDIFQSNKTITKVVNFIKKNNYKIFLGDVVYYKRDNFANITRYYPVKNFKPYFLKFGIMPPHTGSFINKEIYSKFIYNSKFKIAGDFEFFIRTLLINRIKYKNFNFITTRMRIGGISGKNFKSYLVSTLEILKAFKMNNIQSNIFFILLRIPSKLFQLFFFWEKKLNQNFKIIQTNIYRNIFNKTFNITTNPEKINKKNYILSAMNLAFLGSFYNEEIKLSTNLVNWPDGLFAKTLDKDIKKIPGRDLINKLEISKKISSIKVFGNLSTVSYLFLKKRFKKKIINIKLPYGNISELTKINYKIKKNELIFITLPTPKQEQFAHHLIKKNKYYKIICIGGSIAISSGEEKSVPKELYYLEFLWRLRYDTIRRLVRLIYTFFHFTYGRYILRKNKNVTIKIV
jgi:glycosyltransferase involved in cell wall biosynthesis